MNARVSLMVCAATVFIGAACTSSNANAGAGFFSSSSPQARNAAPLPERPAPNGFNLFRDPQGSARVLYGSFSGNARSATAATQGMLQNLRGYFDDAPQMRTFLRDDADQQAQAFFSATLARQPV